MSEPTVEARVVWIYDDTKLKVLMEDVDGAKEKVSTFGATGDLSFRRLAFSMSHLVTASMSLAYTWEAVAKGQKSVIEGVLQSIPALASLAVSIWTLVGAEKARAIAHAIATAIGSGGIAIPLLIAALAAGTAIGYAASAAIPSREYGGRIWQTGAYMLHAGETIGGGGGRTVNIFYPQFSSRSDMDELIDRLRRAGIV
jgi:hypothetical protein